MTFIDWLIVVVSMTFLIAVVVWIFAYFNIRWKEQRKLQREIDELNEIERIIQEHHEELLEAWNERPS